MGRAPNHISHSQVCKPNWQLQKPWRYKEFAAVSILQRLVWLLAILLFASMANAADNADKHPLWRVSSAAGSAYLFGSIHFGDDSMYPLDAIIMDAFQNCDTLAVEANLLDTDLNGLSDLFSKGMYPFGKTLKAKIRPTTWRALQKAAQRYSMPIELFQQQKPWLAALTLSALELQQAGYTETMGIDLYFLRQASERQKPIVELESLAWQMDLFEQFSSHEQEAFLAMTLHELEKGFGPLQALIDAWQRGDGVTIDRLMNKSFDKNPTLKRVQKALLKDRNITMTQKIEALMKAGKTPFVVVGAGHMVGKDGIVQLLKQSGYAVEQL